LFPVALLPASGGQPNFLYSIGALLLSLVFFYYGAQFVLHRSSAAARRLLLASIVYLPLLLVLIVGQGPVENVGPVRRQQTAQALERVAKPAARLSAHGLLEQQADSFSSIVRLGTRCVLQTAVGSFYMDKAVLNPQDGGENRC
jgi:hypothetical protein